MNRQICQVFCSAFTTGCFFDSSTHATSKGDWDIYRITSDQWSGAVPKRTVRNRRVLMQGHCAPSRYHIVYDHSKILSFTRCANEISRWWAQNGPNCHAGGIYFAVSAESSEVSSRCRMDSSWMTRVLFPDKNNGLSKKTIAKTIRATR